jgi:aspartyl-tRNA(Asn)/glutamyl-tRNA(Gln) amidotransferase subunit A
MAISWTMDKIGVLARDARDAALVLGVIAEQPVDASHEQLHVGFVDNAVVSPDPAYPVAWEAAKRTIAGLAGVTTTSLTLPPIARLGAGVTVLLAEREVAFDELIRTGKLFELYDAEGAKKDRVDYPALGLRAEDYVRAMAIRTLLQRAYRDIFANVDVIVAPGRPEIAPLVTDKYKENPENPSDNLNTDGNLCGLPQITAPMGFTASGLPVSLAAVAAPYRDALALDLVARFQGATDFHRRRPRE